jgi:phage/plasmid-like protein (TIGR03299 family)
MSHLLEMKNGKAQMAWAGETPWHGLGRRVPPDLTPQQMLEAAGLNWEVKKYPSYSLVPVEENGIIIKKPYASGWSCLIRESDKVVLDVVSNDWLPVQNKEAFDFFHEFVAAGDMEMHTAGSIKDGQIIWGLAKVKESFELFGGDQVDAYLLFTNFHKYGHSTDVRFTPIRVVCNNTLTLSLNSKVERMVKFSHRREFKPELAKEMLGIATSKLQKYKEMAAFLGSRKAKNEDIVSYFKRIFPHSNPETTDLSSKADQAIKVMESQPGANYAPGTWWQPYNAVTFMTDHIIGRSKDSRLESSWYGANKTLKVRALETAVKMAETV